MPPTPLRLSPCAGISYLHAVILHWNMSSWSWDHILLALASLPRVLTQSLLAVKWVIRCLHKMTKLYLTRRLGSKLARAVKISGWSELPPGNPLNCPHTEPANIFLPLLNKIPVLAESQGKWLLSSCRVTMVHSLTCAHRSTQTQDHPASQDSYMVVGTREPRPGWTSCYPQAWSLWSPPAWSGMVD